MLLLLSSVVRSFVSLAEVPDNRCFSDKRSVFDVSRQRFRFTCCMWRRIGQPELGGGGGGGGTWLDRMQWIGKYIRMAVAVRMVVMGWVVMTFVWFNMTVVGGVDVGGRVSLGDFSTGVVLQRRFSDDIVKWKWRS